MKKHYKTFLAALATFLVMPVVAIAGAAPTQVTGTITISGKTAVNARVIVTCNGIAKRDRSDLNGNYFVQFTAAQCPIGSNLSVTAVQGNRGGVTNRTVTGPVTTANVAVTTTTSVPELGTTLSIAGMALVGGAFVVIRRKQVGQEI